MEATVPSAQDKTGTGSRSPRPHDRVKGTDFSPSSAVGMGWEEEKPCREITCLEVSLIRDPSYPCRERQSVTGKVRAIAVLS